MPARVIQLQNHRTELEDAVVLVSVLQLQARPVEKPTFELECLAEMTAHKVKVDHHRSSNESCQSPQRHCHGHVQRSLVRPDGLVYRTLPQAAQDGLTFRQD